MYPWWHDFINSDATEGLIKARNPFKACRFFYERYKSMGAQMLDNQSIVINKKYITFDQNDVPHIKTIKELKVL